ncbi:MAG: TetR/AcrR family transcriptional regulator [Bacillota bacterium]
MLDIEKKEDRRVLRTKKQLHTALLEMILLKGYESVTIQDIIDRANVGRSTFYAHFYDKRDLLEKGFDQLQMFLSEQKESILKKTYVNVKSRFSFSLAMFQHAQEHYKLYQAFVGKQSETMVQFQIRKIITGLVRDEFHLLIQHENKKHLISMNIVEQLLWGY